MRRATNLMKPEIKIKYFSGAISSYDKVPSYSEGCSALLGLAYSGGDSSSWPYSPGIVSIYSSLIITQLS